ncbi:MAG: peptidoglycan recognition protein family protein [Oscillospiraceae bacterium]|nr:peptidoglycan recognition protein family protein [Oscillospiraceae bacterium]
MISFNGKKNNEPDENSENDPDLVPQSPRVPLWLAGFLGFIALSVIIGAFVIEARNSASDYAPTPDVYIPVSPVQHELMELNWVEQYFLDINPFSRPGEYIEQVNGIVIHNIGNPGTTALQNRNYFNNLQHRQYRFASAHFIICLDGAVLQCVPIDELAFASNIRNYDTISIEVTHPDATGRFTHESYVTLVRLTAWLNIKFGLTSDDVIRHADIPGIVTDCPRYFVNNPEAWDRLLEDIDNEMERQLRQQEE